MKSKRKAPAKPYKSKYSAQNKSYGVGGAVMTLGKNLLQGKKFGSGAFKGVLRAGITPGSGIGAGIGLAGALAGKSKNPTMQKISKGLGVAGNVAGLFTGGGGAGALGGLAGKFAGSGAGQAASKFAGNFAGLDKTLGGIGAASGGNPLMALAQNFMPGMSGAEGMRVRKYEDGGVVDKEPPSVNSLLEALGTDDKRGLNKLLNQQYRVEARELNSEGFEPASVDRLLETLGTDDNQGLNRLLDKEYRENLRSDNPGEEEIEGEGGIDKEQLKKILQALAAGGVGFGAMVGVPKLINLLKKPRSPVDHYENYHNTYDPRPGPRDPFWRQPNQTSGGRHQ